jgi:hypothetical protein
VFEPRHPNFHCTCTREKVGNMLKMLGQAEVDEALVALKAQAIEAGPLEQGDIKAKIDLEKTKLSALKNRQKLLTSQRANARMAMNKAEQKQAQAQPPGPRPRRSRRPW